MTSRTYTCARCDRQMHQPEAFINDQAYCHSDDGPDCYKLTQWESCSKPDACQHGSSLESHQE